MAATASALLLIWSGTAAWAAPSATPAQKAEAIANPSVVFIQTEWSGYLMNGELADILSSDGDSAPAFTVNTICSGFVANGTGSIVTAGHCVDNQSMQFGGKGMIIQAAVQEAVQEGWVSSADAPALITYGYQNWSVEGSEKGSPPDRVITVMSNQAASGITLASKLTATVVSFKPFPEGDVALLKVEPKADMPALQVADATPPEGASVVAMGFPGSVLSTVDGSITEPVMNTGDVSGHQEVAGVPFTGISAATSGGMSGGPVVDMEGRVVGTVSWSPGTEKQSFNFMTATTAIKALLSSQNVDNLLSGTDQRYRSGLTEYFNGKYHAAVKEFDQVLSVDPNHAGAQQYKQLAVRNYPNEKSSDVLLYVLIGAGVLLLLGGGGLAFFLIRRRRKGTGPAGGAAPVTAPSGMAPTGPAPSYGPPKAPTTYAPVAPPSYGPMAPPPAVPPLPPTVPVATTAPTAPTAATEPTQPRAPAESTAPAAPATAGAGAGSELFCPHCGERHEAEAHFCASCGFPFAPSVMHKADS